MEITNVKGQIKHFAENINLEEIEFVRNSHVGEVAQ